MWTLAVLRKDLGQVEIVKLSDKTIEKYEDDLEGLVLIDVKVSKDIYYIQGRRLRCLY
jgi:hypothetical protein